MTTTTKTATETAMDRAIADMKARAAEAHAAREAARSPIAEKIIANNRLAAFSYGCAGAHQMFAAIFTPSLRDIKRRAAECIIAHRQMRAAGGNSDRWIDEAAACRKKAMVLAGVARPLQIGDRVLYRGGHGGHRPAMLGKVTGSGIENGERVFDVTLENGRTHWGYADQFTKLGA